MERKTKTSHTVLGEWVGWGVGGREGERETEKAPIPSHKITEILVKKKNDNKRIKRDREKWEKRMSRCSIATTY